MWFGGDSWREEEDDVESTDGHSSNSADHVQDDYWHTSKRPMAILLFVAPLIAIYELSAHYTANAAGEQVRNGADFWLREALAGFGYNQPWLLPVFFLGVLVVWQLCGRFRWQVPLGTVLGMVFESTAFALCLILIGQTQQLILRELQSNVPEPPVAAIPIPSQSDLMRGASYLGAGIYEEVVFRAALLPICFGVFRIFVKRKSAIVLAVVGSSVLFSLAHYVGAAGEPFEWAGFLFRAIAGLFFAMVMVLRGLGVTVGTHAFYDIIVGIVLPAGVLDLWLGK